jgi:hypothetical protein
MKPTAAALSLTLLSYLTAPSAGQDTRFEWSDTGGYGACVTVDVNSDSIRDLVLLAPGAVRIHSGSDGSFLHSLPMDVGAAVETLTALGDVDGDGSDDVGYADSSNYLYVASPLTQTQIHRIVITTPDFLGHSMTNLGDVNNDGRADFAAGAPEFVPHGSGNGLVRVYSGLTGGVLWTVHGPTPGLEFGLRLESIADLDADGARELVVNGTSHHQVLSGATGGLLRELTRRSIVLPRQGEPEVLASLYNTGSETGVELTEVGTWTTVAQFPDASPWESAGDLNGDGCTDFLGQKVGGVGLLDYVLYSGADGRVLYEWGESGVFHGLMQSPPGNGDVDGDGFDEFFTDATNLSVGTSVRLHGGHALVLHSVPRNVVAGDPLRRDLQVGAPGLPCMTVIENVNGIPLFYIIGGIQSFDATGLKRTEAIVPAGLGNLDLTYRGYAIGSQGGIITSGPEMVRFR